MAPQGANSQVLTCESICFGGSEEDALNVKNNDKRFIFLTLSNFLVKMQFNQLVGLLSLYLSRRG